MRKMSEVFTRIKALVVKEILMLLQDPKGRMVLIGPPIFQLLVFAFAATLEVKNVAAVILNQDGGRHGYEIIQRIQGSPTFASVKFVSTVKGIMKQLDKQKAVVAIQIPQDFSRKLEAGEPAKLQIIMDGRRSNSAQIVASYVGEIVNTYGQELQNNAAKPGGVVVVNRNWFNPNLNYLWFTVPSLVCTLSMLIALLVTAMSVARERELGTFDQVLVSPLHTYEIMLGKVIPAVLIALGEGLLIWVVGVLVLQVPFTGSFWLLLMSILVLVMAIVGVGLCISSFARTQQQATLGAFIFMVPATTLSGYASPIENMPVWLQKFTCLNPLKYSLVSVRGIFLKDMSFAEVWANTWPVMIIFACTLSLAIYFFGRRLE